MTMGSSKEYVKRHLELADEFLEDAKSLLKGGRLRSTIDRSYYSMFYSAEALIIHQKIKPPKTHKGLLNIFGKEIVTKGLIDKEFGKMISKAYNARQASTYEVYTDFGEDKVGKIVDNAVAFTEKIKEILQLGC